MDNYTPGQDMSPRDVKPNMVIVNERKPSGKITSYTLVKKVEICQLHCKGVGRTHVNEKDCYDNAATLDVVVP